MVITHHLRDNVLNNSVLLHADNSFCGDDQIPVITTKSKISGFYNSIYNSFLGMPAFQVILLQDTPEMLCVPVCQLYVTVFLHAEFPKSVSATSTLPLPLLAVNGNDNGTTAQSD